MALLVLGGCLLLTRSNSAAVTLLADLGALALSGYALQIGAIAVFEDSYPSAAAWLELTLLSVVTVLLATLWRQWWRSGLLEALLHACSTKAARPSSQPGATNQVFSWPLSAAENADQPSRQRGRAEEFGRPCR